MSVAPPLPVSRAQPPPAVGFVRAVMQRLHMRPRTWAVVALVLVGLVLIAGYGLIGIAWSASWSVRRARLFSTAVTAILMFFAVVVADEAVERGLPRLPTYTLAIVGAAIVGSLLAWHLRSAIGWRIIPPAFKPDINAEFPTFFRATTALICALVGGLATSIHLSRRTALDARRRQAQAEHARAQAQRRTLESQLQALQARVEPVFLFGTLERIRELYRGDAATAGSMLEDLIFYLRAALPHLRESSSTVGQELTLARAWLDIVGRGTHWKLEFDVAAAAREAALPALVLLPLIQHAVSGADSTTLELHLQVRADDDQLQIELSTTTDAFGSGIASQPLLQQIEERLQALHGKAAGFECERSAPTGSVARIRLPFEPVGAGSSISGEAA